MTRAASRVPVRRWVATASGGSIVRRTARRSAAAGRRSGAARKPIQAKRAPAAGPQVHIPRQAEPQPVLPERQTGPRTGTSTRPGRARSA